MAARKRFIYHPRKTRTGYVWEYTINEEAGLPTSWCEKRRSSGIEVTFARGGKPTQRSEQEILQWCIKRVDKLRAEYKDQCRKRYEPTLHDIIEPYFDYERCPRILRRRTDGYHITRRWAKDQRDRLVKHVLKKDIASRRYDRLIPADFEAWKRELYDAGEKVSVINKTISALKTAINEEMQQGRITHNPLAGVSHIKKAEEDRGYYTRDELYRMFISEAPGCWKSRNAKERSKYGSVAAETAWTLAIFHFLSGERMRAILQLRWQDVELSSRICTFAVTKTTEARMIPLPDILTQALEAHQGRTVRGAPGDYIFCYEDGEPLTYSLFRTRWDNMTELLKMPERDPDGGRRTPYSLKVSLETHLIDSGADPVHVREYMGHSHGSGEKRLTPVQSRYKRRRAEVLREQVIPLIDKLLIGEKISGR